MYDNLIQIIPTPRDQQGSCLVRVYDPFDNTMIQQEFAGLVTADGSAEPGVEEARSVVSKVETSGVGFLVTAPWGETRNPTTSLNQLRILLNRKPVGYFWSTWGEELVFTAERATEAQWDKFVREYSNTSNTAVANELSEVGDVLSRVLNLVHDLSDSVEGAKFLADQDVTPEDAVTLEKIAASYKEAALKPTPVGPGRLGG